MSFKVRVDSLSYFQYRYGHEPIFLFGTNAYGQDILTRMAEGARFSLLFALIISAINLAIGAVYGAIEGFYGGSNRFDHGANLRYLKRCSVYCSNIIVPAASGK